MNSAQQHRQQILALETRLLDAAMSLTHDAIQAAELVRETITMASAPGYGAAEVVGPEIWMFRLLRQRFYSLERDRVFRRARSAFAIELSFERKRALLAQTNIDGLDAA